MKVADVMEKHVESMDYDAKVLDVARIIFGRHINGLPICKNKKLVGFISERDILAKFHPTMQEFTEDPFSASNFEMQEGKVQDILNSTAEDIMNKRFVTVNADDPLLKADSKMRIEGVGRLPVINDKGDLVGIITMGDIFRALVGKKMPYLESEEYHDWIAKHFDLAVGWEDRIPTEIPPLVELFKRKKVKKIIDIGCGTGEHAIALAKAGFEVLGLETSRVMYSASNAKWKELPQNLQLKIKFVYGDYVQKLERIKEEYQAAMFMGNAMAHIPSSYQQILSELNNVLSKENGTIVSHLINFENAIRFRSGLHKFTVKQSGYSPLWKHGYLWFYDSVSGKDNQVALNAQILDFNGKRWSVRGMNAVRTVAFSQRMLQTIFKKNNFPKTNIYGSKMDELILGHKFNIKTCDWMTVVAER